jgi:GTP-binding protein HflX
MWTHLSVKRGIGMRGPVETEIETDRRIVRDRISCIIKDKIKAIDKQMGTQRGNRVAPCSLLVILMLVKSTLMNAVRKCVLSKTNFFATLIPPFEK